MTVVSRILWVELSRNCAIVQARLGLVLRRLVRLTRNGLGNHQRSLQSSQQLNQLDIQLGDESIRLQKVFGTR
jgi:hypothetical protein